MPNVLVSDFILKNTDTCNKYLLIVKPDGTTSIDGGHSTAEGVAEAKQIMDSLACVRHLHPEGTRYFMITVEPVPEFKGNLNSEAISTLNHAHAENVKRRARRNG